VTEGPWRKRPFLLLAVSACIGLAGGLAEVLVLGLLKLGLGRILWLGPHVVWMTPTMSATVALLAGGLPAVALGRRYPRAALVIAILVPAVISGWASLVLIPGLQRIAAMLLAVGVAVQLSRYALKHPDRFLRPAPRLLTVLGLMVMVLGAAVVGREWWTERARIGRLPAPDPAAPNVLLIVMDTQRAASMSLHGYARPTSPRLDRFAQSGVVFDRAIAPSSWTLPAHATMFTGRYPHQLSASWREPLDTLHPTLAEKLTERGFLTGGFVANGFYCGFEYGLDRGFLHYEDYEPSLEEWLISSSVGRQLGKSATIRRMLGAYDIIARPVADRLNARFLRWIDRDPGRPFFAFLNYFDVHHAYLPPAPYDDLYGTKADRPFASFTFGHRFSGIPRDGWDKLTPRQGRAEQDAYDGAVAYLDNRLGMLFEELERRGVLDRTLVIVTSDHGEQFGEHGLFDHGNSVYIQAIHVPLIMRLPGQVPAGVRVAEPVTLRDLPATILGLTGAPDPSIPGMSLAELWQGAAEHGVTSPVFSSMVASDTAFHSLMIGRFHYLRTGGKPAEALFDVEADPEETDDLLKRSPLPAILPQLRLAMDSILADSTPRRNTLK
jgi:arylsulfatase A-like enzyme